jgi:hypothetical protein
VDACVVFGFRKRLREKVGELLLGGDVSEFESATLKMISDKAIPDIDMLRASIIALSVG